MGSNPRINFGRVSDKNKEVKNPTIPKNPTSAWAHFTSAIRTHTGLHKCTPIRPDKQIFHDNKSLFYSSIGNKYKFSLKRHMDTDLYYNDIFGAHCTLQMVTTSKL